MRKLFVRLLALHLVATIIIFQKQVRQSAEREAKENENAERQRAEELRQRVKLLSPVQTSTASSSTTTSSSTVATSSKPSTKTNLLTNNNNIRKTNTATNRHLSSRQPVSGMMKSGRVSLTRSPMSNRSPSISHTSSRPSSAMIDATKEKSRRALKRAQLLQRKKIFDKQLKDAKARILEEARRSGASQKRNVTGGTTMRKTIVIGEGGTTTLRTSISPTKNLSSVGEHSETTNSDLLLKDNVLDKSITTTPKTKTIIIGEKGTLTESKTIITSTSSSVTSSSSSSNTIVSTSDSLQQFVRDSELAVKNTVDATTDAVSTQRVDTSIATTITTSAAVPAILLPTSSLTQTTTSNTTTTTAILALASSSSPLTTSSTLLNKTSTTTLLTTTATVAENTTTTTKVLSTGSTTTSRIVHGAGSFGASTSSSSQVGSTNGGCPCNLKAMFLCKQCGSAWHGDCIDSDTKICISCS